VFVVRERPVPNCDGRHELHQLPCRDCVGVVGCVRLDDMRRVQRRVLLGGRGLGLHELLDGDLPVVKRGELVRSVRGGVLLRVDGPLGVRLVRLRSGDLLELRRDVVYVVRCRAVLGRDGIDVPFMPEREVSDLDGETKLLGLRRGNLQLLVWAHDCVHQGLRRRNLLSGRGELVHLVRRRALPNGHGVDYLQRMRGRDLQLGDGAIHGLLGLVRRWAVLRGGGERVQGV